MKRREFMISTIGALAAGAMQSQPMAQAEVGNASRLGIVIYALNFRNRLEKQKNPSRSLDDPLQYLEFCHSLDAGGIQIPLKFQTTEYRKRIREKSEEWNMHVDGIVNLPKEEIDLVRFDAEIRTAKECGAQVVRTVMMPGRRYEDYTSLDEFKAIYALGLKRVEMAAPVMARHGIHLAIENHKEQRVDDLLHVLNHIDSEYVGVCFDTGNSFALLEDPIEVTQAYAPWTKTVHYKDQAVQECDDGFLFADVQYGKGFLDLKSMADLIRAASPNAHFNLEMITRDPLLVPCLNEKYWVTFPNMPVSDLARSIKTVRKNRCDEMPEIGRLSLEEQVAIEEDNVKSSLRYAAQNLGFA